MSIKVIPVSDDAFGEYAVVSVKFVDGVGRWKVQLNSHRTGLFCFTDRVHLTYATVIVDEKLVQKKIREPDSGHMFIFMGGRLARYDGVPGAAHRINVATRQPKSMKDAYFKYVANDEPVWAFEDFYGDEQGRAWVL
jgi:DNA-binding cell septation regulator SpoVG